MASIPLVATTIKQPESPLSNLSELLHAKAQQQGLQTGQLQQQALQQEIAQRDQQAKDLQATTAAARNWDGKDYDALSKSILKNGGSANAAMSIQQHGLTIKKTVSDIASADATTGSKNLETFIGKHKAVGDSLQEIEKVPDDQLHQAAIAKINELTQGGILEPAAGQQLLQGVQSIQDPKALRDQIDLFAKASMGAKATAEQEKSTAETRQKNAQAALEEIQAKYGTPAMMESKYVAIQQKRNLKQPIQPEDAAFLKAYEKQKELNTVTRFQLNNSGGGLIPQGGGAGNGAPPTIESVPASIRGTVQQILQYRGPMPPSGRNNPNNQAIRYWVNQLDPTYDESSFPARNKILQSYTSGAESKSINAINTALGHLGELGEAAKALDQNDLPLLHSIASKVGAALGSDAPTTYQGILHRVSPEMTAAYVAGGGGEHERGANEGDFALSLGGKQITSNVAESAKLLRSKIGAQEQQWNTTFKPPKDEDKFENRFITPAAKATLDEFSAKAPTSKGNAGPSKPAGATHTGVGSVDKKKHWLDASGKDLGVAE